MKKFLLISGILITAFFSLNSTNGILFSSQPPAGKTGGPGEGLCTDCHIDGTGGDGNVSITFNEGNNLFKYGETYTIVIDVEDDAQSVFGFELTELGPAGTTSGEFTLINQDITALQSENNRDYVSHFDADATNSWEFEWTAPPESSEITEISFYASGNAANGNGSTSGDHIYTASVDIQLDTQGLDDEYTPISKIYQGNSKLNLEYFAEAHTEVQIQLFDMRGRILKGLSKQVNNGNNHLSIDIEEAQAGLHIVSIRNGEKTHNAKVVLR